ncbi:MAG: helix-hairpin-helix domain-containing protein [Phycisphaerae bacterium]|jgi:competence protein ComEA
MTSELPQRQHRQPWGSVSLGVALLLCLAHVPGVIDWQSSHAGQPADTADVRLRLDPNTATADELALLPGVGPTLAARIIEHRESCTTQPAFTAADDLDSVRGFGPKRVAALRPYLRFTTPREGNP